jgi:aspartate-semialdehyde dehydrogenase
MVGQEFVNVLEQRRFPMVRVSLLASDRSAGRAMKVNGQELEVKEADDDSFAGIDIALFSAGSDVSRHFSPIAARSGAVVIDNSAAFRMDKDVPLVVPEVNPEDIKWHHGIIANPNCATIQMVVVLYPLHKVNRIKRIIATTFQSVSGTGTAAVDETIAQTKQILAGQEATHSVYPHRIAFNLLPEIDVFLDDGYTKEEHKIIDETRKIMHDDSIVASATCVRVPVLKGHSEAVTVEFERPMSPEEARSVLAKAPGVIVMDNPKKSIYPQPVIAANTDETYVGRIRSDTSNPGGLVMWIVADNLRKGAALNAVQIAEIVASQNLIPSRGAKK